LIFQNDLTGKFFSKYHLQTHKKFYKSYKDSLNFKHFASFKLQSVYDHFPKFQLLKPYLQKLCLFQNILQNGHLGI